MVYTRCRISEALELSLKQIDWQETSIVLHNLKKRGKKKDATYRAVPVPDQFLDELDMVHRLKQRKSKTELSVPLWSYSRTSAWRKIKDLMEEAKIEGDHANPKGLRHGFGVAHAINKTPLPLIQRWMGHSSPQRLLFTCK